MTVAGADGSYVRDGNLVPQPVSADADTLRNPGQNGDQIVHGAGPGELGAQQVEHRAGLRVAEDSTQARRVSPGGQRLAQHGGAGCRADQLRVRGRGSNRDLLYDRVLAEWGGEQVRGERGGAFQVGVVVSPGADRGGQAHADQARGVNVAPQAADQARDLAAQRPLVGVDLIQH